MVCGENVFESLIIVGLMLLGSGKHEDGAVSAKLATSAIIVELILVPSRGN